MRDEDDGRVSGMTPDEIKDDMLPEPEPEPEPLAVTYVPMMTPEQLALYEAQVLGAVRGAGPLHANRGA